MSVIRTTQITIVLIPGEQKSHVSPKPPTFMRRSPGGGMELTCNSLAPSALEAHRL